MLAGPAHGCKAFANVSGCRARVVDDSGIDVLGRQTGERDHDLVLELAPSSRVLEPARRKRREPVVLELPENLAVRDRRRGADPTPAQVGHDRMPGLVDGDSRRNEFASRRARSTMFRHTPCSCVQHARPQQQETPEQPAKGSEQASPCAASSRGQS